ncbi:Miro-like protein, putative [Trypanosoma equiperdum]|uniref:Uncharacterized protein n=2 Tax=Trypanozoon TaxID=39700 RepID=Q389V9_TRYB2|nr:hypothetical protein, conserved [Trypanosoma brucei brucei TREU927]EAN78411.1 hypothetical protein, conserved [Trypanosoma brucei brucei TREU927]SCU67981.1 Miro-like protein, putative [Trypanosoma equiperdum]
MGAADSPDLLRVLVVGHTGVGKTLFLQRLHRSTVERREGPLRARGHTVGFNVEVISTHRENKFGSSTHVSDNERHIAFVEVGGNRNFGRSGHFPLSLMTFHGVIFVYDHHNIESATDLMYWYEYLKGYGAVGSGGTARVMLVETTHIPLTDDPSSAARVLPDELLGSYLQESIKKAPTFREKMCHTVRSLFRRCASVSRLSVTDFQPQYLRFLPRVAVFLHQLMSIVENLLLFIMAVTLFGPGQKSVSFCPPSVSAALRTIEDDASGTRTLKQCPLYDQGLFEATALEEVLSFLGSLRSA